MGKHEYHRRVTMRQSLAQLDQFPTVSPFLRNFYGLLCEWIEESHEDGDEVLTAFALLLRIEVRHHEALGGILDTGSFDLAGFLEVSRRTREMLGRLLQAIRHIPRCEGRREIIRQLLLAECFYHLGRPSQVVRSLRAAMDLGCSHPIISFALGYNLYSRAVQEYVRLDGEKSRLTVSSPRHFRRLICVAIDSLRDGISGDPFDAQLHWWIGLLSELICERSDAWTAYAQAVRTDPDGFGVTAAEKLRKLDMPVADAATASEGRRLANLPPIADADLVEMRKWLSDADFLPGDFQSP